MIERVIAAYPNLKLVATTLRNARSATCNDWGAVCYYQGQLYSATVRNDLEIYDRVGGGDSFASGLIYGFSRRQIPGVGRGMWSRAWGVGHDHARRHHHGNLGRSRKGHEGRQCARGPLVSKERQHEIARQSRS